MGNEHIEDLPPQDRRGFFAESIARVLRPLAEYLEQRLPPDLLPVRDQLRPPGAIAEKDFLNTCYRCGSCADSCPVNAIKLTRGGRDETNGTPQIDADEAACALCETLACMKACPSGALRPTDKLDIRIGLAAVDYRLCVRSKGEACTECISRCPLGETAIRLDDAGRVHVIAPARTGRGCVGCGLCQQHCPTRPKRAIRVRPY